MNPLLKLKLVPKVILSCLLTAALVFGGLGFYILSSIKSDRIVLLEQGINSDVSFVVSRFQEKEDYIKGIIKIISQNRLIKKALRLNEKKGLKQDLNELIVTYPFINHILISDNDGHYFSSNTKSINEISIDGEALFLERTTNNKHYTLPKSNNLGISDISPDTYLPSVWGKNNSGIWFTMNIFKRDNMFKRDNTMGQVIISIDWESIYSNLLDEAIKELSINKNSIS